jgi:hypothetical protein
MSSTYTGSTCYIETNKIGLFRTVAGKGKIEELYIGVE